MENNDNYKQLLADIIKVVQDTQLDSIERNYKIGKLIKDKQRYYRGEKLIERISKDLSKSFNEGFSVANLRHMQHFYKRFRNYPDLFEYTKQLEWSKIIALLKLNDISETEYYLKATLKDKWTKKRLNEEIELETYDTFKDKIENERYIIDIERIFITNYKSITNFELKQPPRFLVFAGANSSGKSNIFEAFDFLFHSMKIKGDDIFNLFEGMKNVINFNEQEKKDKIFNVGIELSDNNTFSAHLFEDSLKREQSVSELFSNRFINSFSRIFVDNSKKSENKIKVSNKLWFDASNLHSILKEIINDEDKLEDMQEWLVLFIPELKSIKVETDPISGKEEILIFENHHNKPIKGSLISDGTYHILALLSLLYQTNEPQFICIEEPENGLNPKLLGEFIDLFRDVCKNDGHYIWLTTHSQTLVSHLRPEELVIVNKIDGKTSIKRFKSEDFKNISLDEAWLNNLLEGGLPW